METNKQLTEYDIDCITVMMVEAVHIAERCIQMTELYYAEQLRKSQQYEAIRRTQAQQPPSKPCRTGATRLSAVRPSGHSTPSSVAHSPYTARWNA